MEETPPTTEKRRGPQHTREIAWGIILPAASLGVTTAIWLGSLYLGAIDQLSHHSAAISSLERYTAEHNRDASQWISSIKRNVDKCEQCRVDVAELKSDVRARPDPFTGSEGRALEARIHALEERLK